MNIDTFQQAAIDHPPKQWMRIEAGPGTGKTEVLARRIASMIEAGHYEPSQIVAFTYTRAMARDLRERVAWATPDDAVCTACGGSGDIDGAMCTACASTGKVGVGNIMVGTLHSIASKMVSMALSGGLPGGDAIRDIGWIQNDRFAFALPEDVTAILKHAQKLVGKITQKRLLAGLWRRGPGLAENEPDTELRRQLRIRGLITYDDIIGMLCTLVEAEGDAIRDRYRAVLLDERQDLTPGHWKIIDAWRPESLTAVGDSAQAIFGFMRGGTESDVDRPWDARLGLEVNYRSTTDVTRAVNDIRTALAADGACDYLPQTAANQDIGWVEMTCHSSGDGVETTADTVAKWVDAGNDPKSIAVLAATWDELENVEMELEAIGLPVDMPSARNSTWKSLAGRATVALARIAAKSSADDEIDLQSIQTAIGAPGEPVENAVRAAYESGVPTHESLASEGVSWAAAVIDAVDMSDVLDVVFGLFPGWESVTREIEQWIKEDPANVSPSDWLGCLGSVSSAPVPKDAEGVHLRTIHSAKGLQWPVVVIHGACEGCIPPRWSKTAETDLEWGRGLYVAASRAQQALMITIPGMIRGKPRLPTRWLNTGE